MSAPEFQGEPMTRREAVLARREGWLARGCSCRSCVATAKERFPLPAVIRPRVVTDRCGDEWRWTEQDGLECRSAPTYDATWSAVPTDCITDAVRVALLDLLAEPTETVTEEEG